jgi:hypothetical protein
MLPFLGSLIGAGANLLGGIFGQQNQAEINSQNIAAQQAANLSNYAYANQINESNLANARETRDINIAAQREFAQNSVAWRVQDAINSGINPLAALGMQGMSFSNVVAPQSTAMADFKASRSEASGAMAAGLSAAGQNLDRAISALAPERVRAAQLENDLLEAKIANTNADTASTLGAASRTAVRMQPGTGPGIPLPPEDPRGPVINLMQRARDPRTGEIVWIPSEKAASPLQTLGATPTNAALAGRALTEGLVGFEGGSDRFVPTIPPWVLRGLSQQRDYYNVAPY